MLYYERKLKRQGYKIIIGIDEVGRGPLAGPVVASAVWLNKVFNCRIDDSKKMTPQERERSFARLTDGCLYGIGIVGEKLIDSINIYQATRLAMKQALESVCAKLPQGEAPVHVLVDGNMKIDTTLAQTPIVGGDAKSRSIAAASIIAKVTRDRMMNVYDQLYPQYGFRRHKGYSTDLHMQALRQYGISQIHRKSFCSELTGSHTRLVTG